MSLYNSANATKLNIFNFFNVIIDSMLRKFVTFVPKSTKKF